MALLSRLRKRLENPKEDISAGENSLGFMDAFSIGIGGIVGGGIFATIGLAIVESRGDRVPGHTIGLFEQMYKDIPFDLEIDSGKLLPEEEAKLVISKLKDSGDVS